MNHPTESTINDLIADMPIDLRLVAEERIHNLVCEWMSDDSTYTELMIRLDYLLRDMLVAIDLMNLTCS